MIWYLLFQNTAQTSGASNIISEQYVCIHNGSSEIRRAYSALHPFGVPARREAAEVAKMIRRVPDKNIVAYTIRKNWYKRLRAKETLILKTEDAPTELENFKMRNCNVYWIETQLELGKELAVSNWQIGAKKPFTGKRIQ